MYQDHTQQDNNDLTTIAIFVLAEFDVKMKCIAEDLHIINICQRACINNMDQSWNKNKIKLCKIC